MTLLLSIGLFFFIRAASKDRTQQRRYDVVGRPMTDLAPALRQYFDHHQFRMETQDDQGRATFVGTAQASEFLAVFLSCLAGLGLVCLVLVLQSILPQLGGIPWLLLVAAPLAGTLYRQRMQRQESLTVLLTEWQQGSRLQLTGQRDELDRLEASVGLADFFQD